MSLDEERRRLEKRLRELNSRSRLSLDDADYLLQYLDICERAFKNATAVNHDKIKPRSGFESELAILNERFKTKVGDGVLKESLIVLDSLERGYEAGCWRASTQDCIGGNGGESEVVEFVRGKQPKKDSYS